MFRLRALWGEPPHSAQLAGLLGPCSCFPSETFSDRQTGDPQRKVVDKVVSESEPSSDPPGFRLSDPDVVFSPFFSPGRPPPFHHLPQIPVQNTFINSAD